MFRLIVPSTLAVALAACSGSSGIRVNASTSSATPASASASASLDLGNGVALERIAIAVRRVEIEGEDACDGGGAPVSGLSAGRGTLASAHSGGEDHGDDGDDACELEFGPFAIDLSGSELAGGVHWMFDVPVPAGTYDEIEIEVNTVPARKAGDDAVLAELAALHASVAVWGTFDGEDFLFTTPMEIEGERRGAFVVDDESAPAVTFDIDPTGWFGAGEDRLDPRDPTSQGRILANIRASIRLDRDDDGDGCDDDGGTGDRCAHGGPGPG
jgi:hypothetical protein